MRYCKVFVCEPKKSNHICQNDSWLQLVKLLLYPRFDCTTSMNAIESMLIDTYHTNSQCRSIHTCFVNLNQLEQIINRLQCSLPEKVTESQRQRILLECILTNFECSNVYQSKEQKIKQKKHLTNCDYIKLDHVPNDIEFGEYAIQSILNVPYMETFVTHRCKYVHKQEQVWNGTHKVTLLMKWHILPDHIDHVTSQQSTSFISPKITLHIQSETVEEELLKEALLSWYDLIFSNITVK